jgi:hypothetical protein
VNRSFVVVLLVALLLLGSVAVSASEPKATPNWYALRQDMEMFKGALKSIMDDVANAYLPGYGVVFLCECSFKGVDEIKPKLERALIFITPTIVSLPAGERVSIVCYGTAFPDWELTYVSKAGTSANPETWDVYLNVAPE